jgi:hypothetical protein
MEGGIGILLLLIILVVAGVLGIALYLTGGALWFGKTSPEGDRIEGGDGEMAARPEHKHVDQPEAERVHLAGTPAGERAERESG